MRGLAPGQKPAAAQAALSNLALDRAKSIVRRLPCCLWRSYVSEQIKRRATPGQKPAAAQAALSNLALDRAKSIVRRLPCCL